jgi:oligopeptide/dipeptide ABC transporter ATP-binding protein
VEANPWNARRSRLPTKPDRSSNGALVELHDLQVHFALRGSFLDRLFGREAGSVKAVDGVSLELHRGEVLGLVGESGSGKTTLGRALLGLVDPTAGRVMFEGGDTTVMRESQRRALRRRMQIVFQDPHASLNPAMDIGTAVGHPLKIHGLTTDKRQIEERVKEVFELVGLVPAEQFMSKYPSDLSGGQKQRAVLARAVILGPDLLVADEPVSMLDMSVRAKILELMLDLKAEFDLTYLYITHDLATAKFFCDRIAIMYLGRIVEIGSAEAIYADPKHPYTVSLLKAIPEPDPSRSIPRDLPRGEIPDAVMPPLGCSFHPRCPRAFQVCGWEARDLRDLLETRWASLHEDEYLDERALVGDLDSFDVAAASVVVPAGRGHSGDELLALLERIRDTQPNEPFWSGVEHMSSGAEGVEIGFHDGIDPPLYDSNGVRAACLLYNESVNHLAR